MKQLARSGLGTVLVLLLLCLVPAVGHAATLGVWPDTTQRLGDAELGRERSFAVRLGAQYVREGISWAFEEPERGRQSAFYISYIDRLLDRDVKLGLHPVVLLQQIPQWASADPKAGLTGSIIYDRNYRPRDFADYAKFVYRMVKRYSARGVHVYEIWNEANLAYNWPSGPNPEEYAQMLKLAYRAAKAADPDSLVLATGLSNVAPGVPNIGGYDFLKRMLAAGAGDSADAIGFHPYPSYAPEACPLDKRGQPSIDALCAIGEVHRIAEASAPGKPIWLTEIGYSTCTTPFGLLGARCVSEQRQAEYHAASLRQIDTQYPYVRVAIIGELRDRWERDNSPLWADHCGLLRRDYSEKSAFGSVAAYAASVKSVTRPLARPSVLVRGIRRARHSATLHGSIDGHDSRTLYRFELLDSAGRVLRHSAETQLSVVTGVRRVATRFGALRPSTRYRYRLVATNPAGTQISRILRLQAGAELRRSG